MEKLGIAIAIVLLTLCGVAFVAWLLRGKGKKGLRDHEDAIEALPGILSGTVRPVYVKANAQGVEFLRATVKTEDGRLHMVTFSGALANLVISILAPQTVYSEMVMEAEIEVGDRGAVVGLEFSTI